MHERDVHSSRPATPGDDPVPGLEGTRPLPFLGDPVLERRIGDHTVGPLLARHLDDLRDYIRRRSGELITSRESASDLAQSVCREVIEHLDRFQHGSEEGFKKWLFCTAERKIVNRYRYYTAEKRDVSREIADAVEYEGAVLFRTPSRDAMAREEFSRAQRAFGRLPERYRRAIVLSRIQGFTHAEIAREMGTTEGAVRNLVYRGLAAISEELEGRRET